MQLQGDLLALALQLGMKSGPAHPWFVHVVRGMEDIAQWLPPEHCRGSTAVLESLPLPRPIHRITNRLVILVGGPSTGRGGLGRVTVLDGGADRDF